jgi:hypothetical protein
MPWAKFPRELKGLCEVAYFEFDLAFKIFDLLLVEDVTLSITILNSLFAMDDLTFIQNRVWTKSFGWNCCCWCVSSSRDRCDDGIIV